MEVQMKKLIKEALSSEPKRKMFVAINRIGIQWTNGTPHRFDVLASGIKIPNINVPRNNKGTIII